MSETKTRIDPNCWDGYKIGNPKTKTIKRRGSSVRVNNCVPVNEAEHQGRNVQLNKPVRSSDGPKKFHVFVKNSKGNVVKVNFGDPNMEIKKDDPVRRKSFRARHKCDTATDKTSARYWSCKKW